MQGEVPAGREDHEEVPQVQKALHLFVNRKALAEKLPGMPEKQETIGSLGLMGVETENANKEASGNRL